MITFLPIKISATGGTSSFAKKIQAGFAKKGHQVVFEYQTNYDVLLASPAAPLKYLFDAKRRHKKIVHRLDGVYYPTTTAGWLYPLYNTRLRLIHQLFSNVTIYQSIYSKYCSNYFLGKSKGPSVTIYNGVDTALFSPDGPKNLFRDNPDQHIFITASRFRRSDQIKPLIAGFEQYRKRYQDNSKLVIIGNFEKNIMSIPAQYAKTASISFLGIISNEKLPEYLRIADVFLFTHLNPPCPNNVIEAMACGVPICGLADGAMPELITTGQEGELLPTQGNAFYISRRYDTLEFAARMNHIMQNHSHYTSRCRKRVVQNFSLDHMITEYLKVLL